MVINSEKIFTIGTFDILFRWCGKHRWKETQTPAFEKKVCSKGIGRYLCKQKI